MTLLSDIKQYAENAESAYDITELLELDLDGVDQVSNEYKDSGRWYEHWTIVFRRGAEFVAVDYSIPATEMQEVEDAYDDVYVVLPREVTTVVYERVKNTN